MDTGLFRPRFGSVSGHNPQPVFSGLCYVTAGLKVPAQHTTFYTSFVYFFIFISDSNQRHHLQNQYNNELFECIITVRFCIVNRIEEICFVFELFVLY